MELIKKKVRISIRYHLCPEMHSTPCISHGGMEGYIKPYFYHGRRSGGIEIPLCSSGQQTGLAEEAKILQG